MNDAIVPMKWFDRQFTFGLPLAMLPFYLDRLEGTIYRAEVKVKGIDDEILSTRINDKWSIKENIAHLAEVDEIAGKRIDEIMAGISPMSPAVIQPGRDYNAQPVSEILRYLRENRTKNIQKYKGVGSDKLMRASLHPRLKVMMTPVDLAWFDAEHDDHHLVVASEILKKLTK